MKFNKKYIMLIVAFLLFTASIVFFVYTIKANSDDNEIGISYAEITGIKTGTADFSNDGLNYGDTANYHKTDGYVAGNDSNDGNAIVRSFDKVTYDFNLGIKKKDELSNVTGLTAYSDRTILITVTISEDAAKYVVFEENGKPGQTSHTYEIKNVNEVNGSKIDASISLYVLGAPNGTLIDPKFEINESTNNDSNYIVNLGNTGAKHYYSFDATKENAYATAANFFNYLPTVVSSNSDSNIKMSLVAGDSQKTILESKNGRYMNYVLSLYVDGSIKGQSMPKGDIVLTGNFSQTGSENATVKPEFIRLYNGQRTGDILPIAVSSPYSSTTVVNSSNYTRMPGNVLASNVTNNSFVMTISDYSMSYRYPTANADGSGIPANNYYIGSYAITLFSPRSSSDGTNDINVSLSIDGTNVELVNGTKTISGTSITSVNSGYVETDYNLETGLYEMDGSKVTAKSKGAEIQYVTTFNYSSSGSNEGLKEVIKIDPYAFRFMNYTPTEDLDIKVYCGDKECDSLTKSDFEYKFVTGDFNASNYSAANFNTIDSRIKSEDASTIQSKCSIVKNNISGYNPDQIMNLYGGPCISESNPTTYNSLASAVTNDNEEVVLTKLIVQTKNGVKLPDNVRVVIKTKLRVRNVNDTTKIYQVTALATSSDYDNKITYYAPRVVNAIDSEDVVTNPDNYKKGNDTSLFGASLKVLEFETKQKITVTNKEKSGKMKTNYNAVDNETIHFKVTTNLNDYASTVGVDDAWYIRDLSIVAYIPSSLSYLPNDAYIKPTNIYTDSTGVMLEYIIPFAKPNESVPEIFFDAVLTPNITGNGNEIVVQSFVTSHNLNNEEIEFLRASDSIKLYGNGINNMILTLANDGSTLVEKDSEFAYSIYAYNNTDAVINDYSILTVLPHNNDEKGSTFNGKYKVRLEASSLDGASVLCANVDPTSIIEDVTNDETTFTECSDIYESEGKSVTAIKITNISVNPHSFMTPIKVVIIPEGNKYSDVYGTSVVGGSNTFMSTKSNELRYEVISRKISGRVFIDVEESGVQNGEDKGLANIPVTLYRILDDNNIEQVAETTTGEAGAYTFDNLDKGFYKIRLSYDSSSYDLALRYGTEDTDKDSDAYKLDEGLAEISNKHVPNTHEGIDLVSNMEVKHMDMGLINRKPFSMSVKKYITKIDLSYNGIVDTRTYNNQSKVLLSVRNSLNASAKVFYGFEIINDSQVAGYVTNIYEDIPEGLFFDAEDPYNYGWVLVNGQLQNTTFQSTKLLPGESIYTQVVLDMPSREEAGSFLNKVSLEIRAAEEEKEVVDASMVDDSVYSVGEALSYAGLNWHVINVSTRGNDQILTLLVDDDNAYSGSIASGPYKWSKVSFTPYGQLPNVMSILEDNVICDDASGLVNGSYGGTLKSSGHCTSGQYVTSKVRLLTYEEYNSILDRNLSDVSWLYGNRDYYLQSAVNIPTSYNEYGVVTSDFSEYINFVSKDLSAVGVVKTNPTNKSFRYVITINSKYILNY